MNIIGIIPARMASTRFPGKPLAKILGIPMLGHVYFRSKMSNRLNGLYIATCDEEIAQYAKSIGAECVMTLPTHERASERASEAMLKIEEDSGKKVDIVVMIQGDEPMIFPEMIDLALEPMLEDQRIEVVNLMAPIRSIQEFEDPHEVKVVVDKENFALYFSREPIPSREKNSSEFSRYKQVPIIPFRRDFLIKFNALPSVALEIAESVDMLRILGHGYKVKMVLSNYVTYSVDTTDNLKYVENLMIGDPLLGLYKQD